MNKTFVSMFGIALILMLVLVGSTLSLRAAPPYQEVRLPRNHDELPVRQPFLRPELSHPQLQEDNHLANLPAWSKLVFQSYRDNNWEIYLAKGDGAGQTRLTNEGASDTYPNLNRGCTRIAFSSDRTGNSEIFTMNPDGTGLTQVTFHGAHDYRPVWSPDGTKILFNSYRDGQSEVYVMNVDGSQVRRLTWNDGYDGHAVWSPDGTRIAFRSYHNGENRIWVMNADGGGQTQLSNQAYSELPAWSPDGRQIAYDADNEDDGWQELWLMNADGSNQRQVYKPSESQTDAYAGSWSPDGRYVAFARVAWIYSQGNWYWTTAYLDAWDTLNPSTVRLSNQGDDWYPAWQTADAWPPASQVNALPAQSPGPFMVSWSGSDAGLSGLASYDVQVKDGAGGAWTNWQMNAGTWMTSSVYSGIGGHTYYFRSRARDYANNVESWPANYDAFTRVESDPPQSAVNPLPAFWRGDLTVTWGGSDLGGSGIKSFDVQYRDATAGIWTDWQTDTTMTRTSFLGTEGHTYSFRSRATDSAQNVEPWPPGNGDTSTTFYTWAVTGTVRDNRDTPLSGMTSASTPGAFAVVSSNGTFGTYVASSASTYTVTWEKSGYSNLPPTSFDGGRDAHLDLVLPPVDNVVWNGHFECGDSDNWLASGVITPLVSSRLGHTGANAAQLGQLLLKIAGPGSATVLKADERGNVHAAWVGGNDVYYARRMGGGAWSAPERITWTPANWSGQPQIAIDGELVHIVWAEMSGTYTDIYYARRTGNGGWSAPLNIANIPDGVSSEPQVVVDGNGVVHVAWGEYQFSPDRLTVFYAWQAPDGTWSLPLGISAGVNGASGPKLAVDATGVIHTAWMGNYPSDLDIYYAQRSMTGIWSSPQNISNNAGWSRAPQLAIDSSAVVHVVWADSTPGISEIFYARRETNGAWSAPLNISNNPLASQAPQLEADKSNAIHTVWYDSNFQVFYNYRSTSGAWSTPYKLSTDESFSSHPQLKLDRNGSVHVVWFDSAGISYARRASSGDWRIIGNIVEILRPGPADQTALQLEVVRDETVHVVSEGYDGIYHSALGILASDSKLTQVLSMPMTMTNPTLSYLYQLHSSLANGGSFEARLEDSDGMTTLMSITEKAEVWTHRWFDLTPWVGETITLTFQVHSTSENPTLSAYLDEVSIGSAHPDVWVRKSGRTIASPGDLLTYTLTYGNQSGVLVGGRRITDTLPTGILFAGASLPPMTTAPSLVWDVGNLAAHSGPFTIVITATVAPTITLMTSHTNTVSIGATWQEWETSNNTAQAATFVARYTYLPVVLKNW